MSGEFGDYGVGGYMHDKIRVAIEDCEGGCFYGTKKLAIALQSLPELMRHISYIEAYDSGVDNMKELLHLRMMACKIAKGMDAWAKNLRVEDWNIKKESKKR